MSKTKTRIYYSVAESAQLPCRASEGSSGYDLRSLYDVVIEPGETALIKTGLRLAMPAGIEVQVRPRSGLSLRTALSIPNSPGTIDADYRDELCVIARNTNSLLAQEEFLLGHPQLLSDLEREYKQVNFSEYFHKKTGEFLPVAAFNRSIYLDRQEHPLGSIYIAAGDRVAQLVFMQILQVDWQQVEDITKIGSDRGGGFGSSGIE